MTTHPTAEELKEVITPFKQRHLTPGEEASLQEWSAGQKDFLDTGKGMMDEAKALMASEDVTSAAAMDFARRFRALTKQLTSGPSPVLALQPKIRAMVDDARSDPEASQKLEVFSFIERALTNLNAHEGITEGKG